MTSGPFAAAALAGLLLVATEGRAEGVSASDPYSIVRALKDQGHVARLLEAEDGSPRIDAEVDGLYYSVYFFSCDATYRVCHDLLFDGVFDVVVPATAEFANAWNVGHAAGTAVVDEWGDPHVSYFVSATGGLSRANFASVLDIWTGLLGDFADAVWAEDAHLGPEASIPT